MTIAINNHNDLDAVLNELRMVYPNLANLYFKDAKSIAYYSKTIKELYGLEFILNASIVSNLQMSKYSDIRLIGRMKGHIQIDSPIDLTGLEYVSIVTLNCYQPLPFKIDILQFNMSNVDLSIFDVNKIRIADNHNIFIDDTNVEVFINGKTSFYGRCGHIKCEYYLKGEYFVFAEFESFKIIHLNHPLLA